MKKSTGSSTAREIFVDTSGFYALLVRADEAHDPAVRVAQNAQSIKRGFVTTDYVLDETATLLLARRQAHLAELLFETVSASKACRVEWVDTDRFEATRRMFLKHRGQNWSFTDCMSFQVMRELGLTDALTKDEHFERAGFKALLRRGAVVSAGGS